MASMYEIKYRKTGSGEKSKVGACAICTCGELKNGERINDLFGVVKAFEEFTENLGSYENRHSIISIELIIEW